MAIGEARHAPTRGYSANWDFLGFGSRDCGASHHELLRLVVVGDYGDLMMICNGGRTVPRELLYEVRVNLGGRDGGRTRRGFTLKFSGGLVENLDFLGGIECDTLHGLPRFCWRNDDPILQIEGRLAFDVVRMPWNNADFVACPCP
jgi:hypothetical protein